MPAAWLLSAIPAAAGAQGPEQLDQLEPRAGEWQAEYFATIGTDGGGEHAVEAMFGLSDRLAVGFEVEAEYEDGGLAFETLGPKLLYRVTQDDAPVAMGVQVQLGFDSDARLAEAETRLIAEVQDDSWWAQGNVLARRSREDQGAALRLAYAGSLQHAVGESAWFGIEASGQSSPLSGPVSAADGAGHFAGPSLTLELETRAGELEFGIAYLHRIGGAGPGGTGRLFAQMSF